MVDVTWSPVPRNCNSTNEKTREKQEFEWPIIMNRHESSSLKLSLCAVKKHMAP